MACSIAGKISSPLRSTVSALPSVKGVPITVSRRRRSTRSRSLRSGNATVLSVERLVWWGAKRLTMGILSTERGAEPRLGTVPRLRSPSGRVGQLLLRGRAAVPEERPAAQGLVVLPDPCGRLAKRVQGTQEAAVGLVLPGDRPVPLPPASSQRIQAPVVAGAGVGVALDGAPAGQRRLSEQGPGQRRGRMLCRDLGRVRPISQLLPRRRLVRDQRRRRPTQQVLMRHTLHSTTLGGRVAAATAL